MNTIKDFKCGDRIEIIENVDPLLLDIAGLKIGNKGTVIGIDDDDRDEPLLEIAFDNNDEWLLYPEEVKKIDAE